MKEKLKNNKIIYKIYKYVKCRIDSIDFYRDRLFFLHNYIFSKNTNKKSEYNIMLSIHQLEKGMTSSNLRPFGLDKVKNIINIIKTNPSIIDENNYVYNYAMSILEEYRNVYKDNDWLDKIEYNLVCDFLSDKRYIKIPAGSKIVYYNDIKEHSNIDLYDFLSNRHSVRNFSSTEITNENILKAVEIALLSPSACNRQMCKVYYTRTKDSREYVKRIAQGLSLFDKENVSFFIITFDVNSNSFVGERNQGWFNAGLFSMNFVNALHSLGIGSCFVQFGNSFKQEKIIKSKLNISNSERIAVIIAAGYYNDKSIIPCSTRKSVADIYFER